VTKARRIRGRIIIEGIEEDAQPEGSRRPTTVRGACERWLETYVQTQRAEQGRELAAQRARDYLYPYLGDRDLTQIEGEDVRSYRLYLERKTHLSKTTVHHVLSDVRCLFRWAEGVGLIDRSPFPRRVMPRLPERSPDRLTDAEVALVVALPHPYGIIARFGIATGLRWGELVRARSEDIWQGELVVHISKNGRVRRIPLPPALAAELAARPGRILPITAACGFADQVRRRTGIARFHAHMMRHTFGCRWLEAGGSLAALQELLGHRSIITTQRYARLSADMVRREAARVHEGWVQ
jgi:integrase